MSQTEDSPEDESFLHEIGTGEPFSFYAEYTVIYEIQELFNIRKNDQNEITADINVVDIPEGSLFEQTNSTKIWDDLQNGCRVTVELTAAFYNQKRAWILTVMYDDENWGQKHPDEYLDDVKIITYEEGLEILKAHS